jgi:hypothetical protein
MRNDEPKHRNIRNLHEQLYIETHLGPPGPTIKAEKLRLVQHACRWVRSVRVSNV